MQPPIAIRIDSPGVTVRLGVAAGSGVDVGIGGSVRIGPGVAGQASGSKHVGSTNGVGATVAPGMLAGAPDGTPEQAASSNEPTTTTTVRARPTRMLLDTAVAPLWEMRGRPESSPAATIRT
jgi:hypothetical protein